MIIGASETCVDNYLHLIICFADTEAAGADESNDLTQLVIPDDALLFNDSLDEEADPKALLELADDANLPAESAAAEPQADSNHPAQGDLDDSLNIEDGELPNDLTQAVEETTCDNAKRGSVPVDGNVDLIEDSLQPKKSESCPQEKQSSSETTTASKAAGVKVKPSFGKKKKAFSPPKMAQKASSDINAQPKDQSGSSVSDKSAPKPSKFGEGEQTDPSKVQSTLDSTGDAPTTEMSSSPADKGKKLISQKANQKQRKKEKEQERVPKKQGKGEKKLEGEKKKGFTPPSLGSKSSTSCQSDSDAQPVIVSDQSSSDGCSKGDQQPDPKCSSSSAKSLATEDRKVAKKVTQEKRKKEKEEKERERALKKQEKEQKKLEREKKKAELERQREEKKLELEQKKAEREQKKIDKELKKIEREQKKAEKQAKQGKEKKVTMDKHTSSSKESSVEKKNEAEAGEDQVAVREDKEVDAKMESKVSPESSGEEPCGETAMEEKNHAEVDKISSETNTVNSEPEPYREAVVEDKGLDGAEQELKDTEVSMKSKAGSVKSGADNEWQVSEVNVQYQENTPPGYVQNNANNSVIDDPPDKIPIVVLSPVAENASETSGRIVKKQKMKSAKKFTPPKSKKEESAKTGKKQRKEEGDGKCAVSKSSEKSTSKKAQSGRGKRRKASDSDGEPEAKRSMPVNYHGPVWVQCENVGCKKWRLLKECDDPATIPSKWVCSMNTDPDHNSCSAEEERWSDPGDSQEFVESPYIPGSIVWSKMDGYPWLAMIMHNKYMSLILCLTLSPGLPTLQRETVEKLGIEPGGQGYLS